VKVKLINTSVNTISNSVCFIYSILDRDAANEINVSSVLMSMHGRWRVLGWVNGKEIPKLFFSTRFHQSPE
tara:strand:+ start:558 stop:770 length:213 start_codon:yes stop_codon:yes gene_type:complete